MRKQITFIVLSILAAMSVAVAAPDSPPASKPGNDTLESKLKKPMKDCRFQARSLVEIAAFLRDMTGVPILFDRAALEAASVDDRTLLTFNITKATRQQGLDALANALSKPDHPIIAGVVGSKVVITSPERLKQAAKQYQADAAKAGKDDVAHLNGVLPDLNFVATRLSDAIDFLTDAAGAKIAVDWTALQTAGVTKDTPIDLRLEDVSLHEDLRAVLDEATDHTNGKADFDFTVAPDGTITIVAILHAN